MEKRHQTFAGLSLDLSWNKKLHLLSLKIVEKNQNGGRKKFEGAGGGGTFSGVVR